MAGSEQPLVRSMDHSITLPVFEGPLDLLLFLIRKNEIDIYDIPIESVTRQYLEMLHRMEQMNLEIAGEFFVMAATLMVIKSRLLLPKDQQPAEEEDDDNDIDPRWELVQQLIEYKKFKTASSRLDELIDEARNRVFREVFSRQEAAPERPLKPTDQIALWNVFNQVLRRLSEKIIIGQINDETVTVAERMEDILHIVGTRPSFSFSELITGKSVTVPYIISTFLALLELTRLKRIDLQQDDNFTDILCSRSISEDDGDDKPPADPEELTYQG